jgi:amino acid adenylation domain-containing protein
MQNMTSAGFRPSPQQMRLWAAQQDGTTFFSECVLHFAGQFAPDALQAALSQAIARHEALRTSFARQPGMKFPLQVIGETGAPVWRDLGVSPSGDALAMLRAAVCSTGEGGPATGVQGGVVQLAPGLHAVFLRAPTLCVDAASLRTLAAECCASLTGSSEGDQNQPLQYADFAEWQHQTHEAEDARAAREQWLRPALREPPLVRLLGQSPWPAPGPFAPQSVVVSTPPEVQQGIAALARQWQVSTEAVLLAAWQALLGRLLGQTEVVLRCLFDGRAHEQLQGAIGLYGQALPIAADLEGRSFADLVHQAAAALEEASRVQDHYTADPAREAVAAASLPAFEHVRWPKVRLANGALCSVVRLAAHVAPFLVKLSCLERDDELVAELFYDHRALSCADAGRIGVYFTRLLAHLVSSSDSPLESIDLLDEAERHQLLVTLNQTDAAYPKDQCIQQLFERQSARTPEAPALAFEGRKWSYAELNARANQIARLLRHRGVARNVAVGLYLERSAESVLGLLAVLKAGGAYLPLMVGMPPERLDHQLSRAAAPVLLTEEKLLGDLPESDRGKALCFDRDRAEIDRQAPDNLEPINDPEDLVYVIYTSGSTGSPKGVAVRHRNLVNYTTFLCQRLGVEQGRGAGLCFATVSTLAADLGNTCVFPALVSGACLHVIGYEMSLSGTALGRYAAGRGIDVLKITPSHLRSLLADPDGKHVLPRRHLVLGGEASSWQLVQQMRQAANCAILNHYGPTETTVGALTYPVPKGPAATETVPLGRPIANTKVYVLDAHRRPVPFGVPGELFIGGAGVAAGYVGQPGETAAHFVVDPFQDDASARMYKTGDRVRYVGNGDLEFLGRVDRQVKVHGFRVEPGEIEAVLQRHPSVRQAVVVARQDKAGAPQLVAYVVLAGEGASGTEGVREHLKQFLPEYMVPAALVSLKALPLTANGKVDTRALPAPEQAAAGRTRPFVAPRNDVEETLAAIWKEVLGVDLVGADDDFFDLGGHSLLATQVAVRVQTAFQVPIPLRTIFQCPTLASLAEAIVRHRDEALDADTRELLAQMQHLSENELQRLLAAESGGAGGAAAGT